MSVTRHRYEVAGWGVGEIWVRDGVLVLHELAAADVAAATAGSSRAARARPHSGTREPAAGRLRAGEPRGGTRPPGVTLATDHARKRDGFVPDLCRRFAAHLAGQPTAYGDIPIDLAWFSAFQADLALALQAVPWGEVVTYGELAALAGRPGAARAAGSFCARSPYALVLPCHRVVAAAGIGGYGPAGVALKRRLLALEGIRL